MMSKLVPLFVEVESRFNVGIMPEAAKVYFEE
jgi:hypothetical protein